MDPGLRASDDDRQRVVTSLERHTAAGRLTLEEFSERVGLVYASVTCGELARITNDLPTDAPGAPGRRPDETNPNHHRQLLVAFLLAAITIVVLGLVLAAGR